MKTWHKVLVVALAVAAAKAPAYAQYTNPYTGTTWNNPMSSYLDTVNLGNQRMSNLLIQQSINRSMLKRSLERRRGKSPAQSVKRSAPLKRSAPSAPKKSSTTSHAATPTVADGFQSAARVTSFEFTGTSVMSQKLAQMLSSKEEERPKNAKIFAWCLQSVRGDFLKNKSANLPTDNVARALAYSLMSWQRLALTRNGEKAGQRQPDISPAQANALRVQAALALSADPRFRVKSNLQKQQTYEMLMIMTGFVEAVYGTGLQQNNVEMQELARGMARDNLKELLGINAGKMRFTEAGLQF